MRRILFTLALVAVPIAGIGCASNPCSLGYGAWIGKPPAIASQTILGQSMQTFQGQGIASGPVGGHVLIAPEAATMSAPAVLPMPSRSLTMSPSLSSSPCTLEDVCRMLALMSAKINQLAASRPMPGGE